MIGFWQTGSERGTTKQRRQKLGFTTGYIKNWIIQMVSMYWNCVDLPSSLYVMEEGNIELKSGNGCTEWGEKAMC